MAHLFLVMSHLLVPLFVLIQFKLSLLTLILMPFAISSYSLLREDFLSKRLPNRIMYPTILATVLIILLSAIVRPSEFIILSIFVGASLSFMIAFLLYLIARGGFGAGDVKLFFLTGLVLSSINPIQMIQAGIFSILGLTGYSIFLIAAKKASLKSAVPFGPFIIIGTWVSVFLSR